MRGLMIFDCEGAAIGATLDTAQGRTGVLIASGGTQTRIGSHRMFERLGQALAAGGYPCFRFDRRGVGDSEGEDPGFRGNGPDIAAAAAAFRHASPQVERLIGLGLCDGATSLALFGAEAKLAGLILINPWFVEAEAGAPPAAAIQHHYRTRLLSLDGWRRLLTGGVSYRKLFAGIVKVVRAPASSALADEIAQSLKSAGTPVELILARDDATAVAARSVWASPVFRSVAQAAQPHCVLDTDAHTFSRPGDAASLLAACLAALQRFDAIA
jgi:exosortase A-associated hydrolase 1